MHQVDAFVEMRDIEKVLYVPPSPYTCLQIDTSIFLVMKADRRVLAHAKTLPTVTFKTFFPSVLCCTEVLPESKGNSVSVSKRDRKYVRRFRRVRASTCMLYTPAHEDIV